MGRYLIRVPLLPGYISWIPFPHGVRSSVLLSQDSDQVPVPLQPSIVTGCARLLDRCEYQISESKPISVNDIRQDSSPGPKRLGGIAAR
jgi:hypothetical protein